MAVPLLLLIPKLLVFHSLFNGDIGFTEGRFYAKIKGLKTMIGGEAMSREEKIRLTQYAHTAG